MNIEDEGLYIVEWVSLVDECYGTERYVTEEELHDMMRDSYIEVTNVEEI